mmetsp:Transcript_2699/g.7608  ORF Transcript_2699/g.7608 Transcript_2699/m.7608 type:complete len:224 (-) Transcript_2699:155-826(-)
MPRRLLPLRLHGRLRHGLLERPRRERVLLDERGVRAPQHRHGLRGARVLRPHRDGSQGTVPASGPAAVAEPEPVRRGVVRAEPREAHLRERRRRLRRDVQAADQARRRHHLRPDQESGHIRCAGRGPRLRPHPERHPRARLPKESGVPDRGGRPRVVVPGVRESQQAGALLRQGPRPIRSQRAACPQSQHYEEPQLRCGGVPAGPGVQQDRGFAVEAGVGPVL